MCLVRIGEGFLRHLFWILVEIWAARHIMGVVCSLVLILQLRFPPRKANADCEISFRMKEMLADKETTERHARESAAWIQREQAKDAERK